MSIGQQLSPDAQYQLALKMPLDRLMAIIRGQPAQIDPATALAALKMHNQTKVAVQGQQAQQQLQKPDVANQEMQMASLPENSGVGRLPANNMNGIATAAQGGIVGYADGGEVQHFQAGGPPFFATPGYAPYSMAGPRPRTFDEMYPVYPRSQEEMALYPRLTGEMAAPAARNAAPAAAPAARNAAASASNVQMLPTGPMPPEANGLTMGNEKPTPEGLAALQQGPVGSPAQAAAPAEGVTALRRPATTTARTAASKPYSDAMTEALKALTSSPEEVNKKKDEQLGVMALEAASALLQPGTTGAGARSAVFSKMSALTQQYGKEAREDKRAALGAKISVLGAQMNNANQQEQNAITLENHAEDTAFRYADLAGKKAQYAAENSAKERGLSIEEQKNSGLRAYQKEMIRVHDAQIKSHEKLGLARIAAIGGRDSNQDKLIGQYITAANTALKALADGVGPKAAEAKRILADPALVRQYALTLMSRDGGGQGAEKPSIQRDTLPGKISALSDDED